MASWVEVMRNPGRAVVLLLAVAGEGFAWRMFDDKPQAHAAFSSLLGLVLFAMLRAPTARLLSSVCLYGVITQSADLACAMAYEGLSSRELAMCDEGTGLPVQLVYTVAFLCVAADFLRGPP